MILTKELLEAAGSNKIGFTREQFAIFNRIDPVNGPPRKNWKKAIVGAEITDSLYSELVAAKNKNPVPHNFYMAASTITERRNRLIEKATYAEIKFKNMLDFCNIKYEFQKSVKKYPFTYFADFYLVKPYKAYVEIDGKYHETPDQVKKDEYRTERIGRHGSRKVIRFTNEFILKHDYAYIADELMKRIKP